MKNNNFGNLGFTLIGIYFLFNTIGGIFGASIANKLGVVWTCVISGLAQSIFVFILILPAWRAAKIKDGTFDGDSFFEMKSVQIAILCTAYAISGAGSVIMWVS